MKKLSLLLIIGLLLLITACTADEIETDKIQGDDTQEVFVDPTKVKPPTGG